MVDREKLVELAERIEKAAGPSCHLDTQVFIALDPDAQHIVGTKPGPFPQDAIYGPRSTFWEWALDESIEPPTFASFPAYTASLDAAMTLVPEGCGWIAGYGRTRPDEPMGGAAITREAATENISETNDVFAEGEAATPALALTAACLRAIASGIEAATAGETHSGSTEGESPVPKADAQGRQP